MARKHGEFSSVREAYKTHVCQEFQLENDGAFLHWFSWLCISWCLVGRGGEVEVAQSSASSFQQDDFLPVFCHVADVFACFCIIYGCSAWHFDVCVRALFAS